MSATVGRVLIVDDDPKIRDLLSYLLSTEGFEPQQAPDGERALALLHTECPDVMLLDIRMPGLDGREVLRRARTYHPDLSIVTITGMDFVQEAVETLPAGACEYLLKPFKAEQLLRSVRGALRTRKERSGNGRLGIPALRESMGSSSAVEAVCADAARVAASDFSVLILGETGVGKDLVARAIHHDSQRAGGLFLAVDCGAIPETLFETELFGHEKGAFTGSHRDKPGKFELASHGTLFLDEVSNMALGCQAKLLRALQEKCITRIGGLRPIDTDARLLAASNQNIENAIVGGTFRCDLFFRLNEFVLRIPPLRERKEDIQFLANRFLEQASAELHKAPPIFASGAVERLLSCDWPGNVRQLRSTIRRAALLADGVVDRGHLRLPDPAPAYESPPLRTTRGLPLRELVQRVTSEVERAALIDALRATGGNKARAARLLQIDYKTMHLKLRGYGIDRNAGRYAH